MGKFYLINRSETRIIDGFLSHEWLKNWSTQMNGRPHWSRPTHRSPMTKASGIRGGSAGGRSPPLAANFLTPSVNFCLLSKAHIEISRFAPSIRSFRTYTECNKPAYCRTSAFLARVYFCHNESFNLFLATLGCRQFQGAPPPWSPPGALPPGLRWGQNTQTPLIGSRSRARQGGQPPRFFSARTAPASSWVKGPYF